MAKSCVPGMTQERAESRGPPPSIREVRGEEKGKGTIVRWALEEAQSKDEG